MSTFTIRAIVCGVFLLAVVSRTSADSIRKFSRVGQSAEIKANVGDVVQLSLPIKAGKAPILDLNNLLMFRRIGLVKHGDKYLAILVAERGGSDKLKFGYPKAESTTTPSTDTPATDTPATDTPATDTPATDTPATDTPATDTPATDTPATDTPATDTPATDTPATDTPATDTPATTAAVVTTPKVDERAFTVDTAIDGRLLVLRANGSVVGSNGNNVALRVGDVVTFKVGLDSAVDRVNWGVSTGSAIKKGALVAVPQDFVAATSDVAGADRKKEVVNKDVVLYFSAEQAGRATLFIHPKMKNPNADRGYFTIPVTVDR